MCGLQATHELEGLNVEVQKITMLCQGPKQYKGLKSRKKKKSIWVFNKKKGGEAQIHGWASFGSHKKKERKSPAQPSKVRKNR